MTLKPPNSKNYKGDERSVGLEIEYAGLPLQKAAELIEELYGGQIDNENSAVFIVHHTDLGDFRLELDAKTLQALAEITDNMEEKGAESIIKGFGTKLGRLAEFAGEKIVPFEIISPPIRLSLMPNIENLRRSLMQNGAKDTRYNFYSAFGLHINPDVSSLKSSYILAHIQSFLLLAPWLKELHDIDLTRRLTSFIDPFPKAYLELVLDKKYNPDIDQLITDYCEHNPTRNRALDMLPLFAHINEEQVQKLITNKVKINKRPTFHYRMPNCELANKDWSFQLEWERWLLVEKLAANRSLLNQSIDLWTDNHKNLFSSETSLIGELKKRLSG